MRNSLRPFFRLVLAAALLTTLLPACETTKKGFPEMNSTDDELSARKQEASSKLVATVGERGLIKYQVPREQLALAFARQFGDGTSIDKTMVRKVQGTKGKASYYLVGLGLRNGMFRGMALPLSLVGESELSLRSNADRYIITGVGCTFCFFNFDGDEITGTTCEENTGGSSCDLRVADGNTLFPRR